MDFKAKVIDIEQGQNEAVLNEWQAKELDLSVMDRVLLKYGQRSAVAIVDHSETFIQKGEIGLFHEVTTALGAKDGDNIALEPTRRPASLDFIRKKLDGGVLQAYEINAVITDLMQQRLSSAELASFVSAIYVNGLSTDETAALTDAIIASGDVLRPPFEPVASEHSIGGVAGGRASIVMVPILASMGVCVPKTASRAISSAAATADVMEVLAPVTLDAGKITEVLKTAGACIVWGGKMNIAAADDKLIQIRHPLRLDPQPLLIASILAKKKAEGAQYVVLDIPCGRGAKVESLEKGRELARAFEVYSAKLGIQMNALISDGSEPLMTVVGPALEARGVLELLASKGESSEKQLLEKACTGAGVLLQMIRGVSREEGYRLALEQVHNGKAYEKFKQIIAAQGGDPNVKPEDIETGGYRHSFFTNREGRVSHIDNKAISRVVRSLGSPQDKKAGMIFKVAKGARVNSGEELFQLVASSQASLDQGIEQAKKTAIVELERVVLEIV